MNITLAKFLYWTPRILCIVFALFLSVFSFDVLEDYHTFWMIMPALFMHNIPTLVIVLVTVFAWKREIIGAIAFFLLAMAYIPFGIRFPGAILLISGPQLLVAVLFFADWRLKRSHVMPESVPL